MHPALARGWRDATTLQVGVDPERAVVLGGLDPASAALVASLDGSRTRSAVLRDADAAGLDAPRTAALLDLLEGAGVLADAAEEPLPGAPPAVRARLAPDLAGLSVRHGPDGAARALARRRAASVRVLGAGRVGGGLAALLVAAGVGRVVPDDPAPAAPGDVPPGAPPPGGATREDAVRALLARSAPDALVRPGRRHRPDLVVLVAGEAPGRGRAGHEEPWLAAADAAARDDVVLLHVAVRETTGVVGPLVVPGATSCLRCQQFHRAERDPAWPRLAGQLAAGPPGTAPCDAALAAATAALGALHALAWLDGPGERLPSSAGATLELTLPEGQVRRRPWPAHPSCGCRWPEP
ncbi:thiamine biosynthesis protein ThiF [Vallicoccus soli]|uniref:Thiamine biosynthesis protein ThiF n=1 Tax=Vallicoccus soli TaxID=2339232 RepID=A0A3A3Z620_9ACTN|nr:thiamine biosynthesis protein ThiF [Vallicoccus soli]